MRLTRIAAATLVAGSLTFAGTGIALADTVTPVTASSAGISAVSEPALLQLSSTTARPGSQITFSGTFAEPAADTVASSTDLTAIPDGGSDVLPWVLGGAGVLVLAGGGAYAIGRGRRSAQAGPDDREPRTTVMARR